MRRSSALRRPARAPSLAAAMSAPYTVIIPAAPLLKVALSVLLSSAAATEEVDTLRPVKPAAPAAPQGCRDSLTSDGVRFSPRPLRPSRLANDVICEAPEG